MEIGILTFHDGINHGAYLQCYALMKTIEDMGHNVTIINYKNRNHWLNEYKCFLFTKNPVLLLRNIIKIAKFKRSHNEFNLTPFTFFHEKTSAEHFDAIVIGSDIVWDFKNFLVGFDPIYFGHYLNTDKLISYAASFGAIGVGDDPPSQVINGLSRFHSISVRDKNSKDTVKKICNREAKIVLDPTFLYDFSGQESLPNYEKFILVYAFFIPEDEITRIKQFARERGLKLIGIGYRRPWCDINKVAVDPFEWLGYFKKADFVVTSTFHGTIFSIKYNKSFCISMNDAIRNKVKSILINLSLEDRVISSKQNLEDILCKEIDYHNVNTKIDHLVRHSKEFLEEALND